jgi:hypothetical protein
LDYLKATHFPKNLEQGQINAKVFKVNEVSAFVIAEFDDKKSADKIKMMNNSEINELKTTLKVRSFVLEAKRIPCQILIRNSNCNLQLRSCPRFDLRHY